MRKLFDNKVFVALAINAIIYFTYLAFAAPVYNTNDDVTMMHIVSGIRNGGQPSPYMVASNILIGKTLSFFFEHWPGVNWYSCYIVLAHFIAMTIILYLFLKKKPLLFGLALYGGVFIFLELPLLLSLQYTSTAFLVFLSGFLLFIAIINGEDRWVSVPLVISVIMMAAAGMIRPDVFYMAILLTTPLFIFKYWGKKDLRVLFYPAIAIALFYLLLSYDGSIYNRNSDWKSYKQSFAVRARLIEYPMLSDKGKLIGILQKINWSKNDYDMLNNWLYFDRNIYSEKNLRYVADNIRIKRGGPEEISLLKKIYRDNRVLIGFTLVSICAFLLCGPKKQRPFVLLGIASGIVMVLYLSVCEKLPDRVLWPIIYFADSLVLFSIDDWEAVRQRVWPKMIKYVLAGMLVLFTVLALKQGMAIYKTDRQNQIKINRFDSMINDIHPLADQLYICWGAALKIQYFKPFVSPSKYGQFNYLGSGWLTHSPLNDNIFRKYHIKNIYLSLVNDKNLYLICTENKKILFRTFMQEHYHMDISFKTVKKYGRLEVLKVIRG